MWQLLLGGANLATVTAGAHSWGARDALGVGGLVDLKEHLASQ